MNLRFFPRGHRAPASVEPDPGPAPRHRIDSGYDSAICRFTLQCSCGARADTRYVDEALEWHELHLLLAPLADELPS